MCSRYQRLHPHHCLHPYSNVPILTSKVSPSFERSHPHIDIPSSFQHSHPHSNAPILIPTFPSSFQCLASHCNVGLVTVPYNVLRISSFAFSPPFTIFYQGSHPHFNVYLLTTRYDVLCISTFALSFHHSRMHFNVRIFTSTFPSSPMFASSPQCSPPPHTVCQPGEWQCKGDGSCINDQCLCNGYWDCADGSDERGCVIIGILHRLACHYLGHFLVFLCGS